MIKKLLEFIRLFLLKGVNFGCDHGQGKWYLPETGKCWKCGQRMDDPKAKKYY